MGLWHIRACLKNHSCNLHALLCGIFHPNSVVAARYGSSLYFRQILIFRKCRTLVAYIPVIAAIAAKGLSFGADQPGVHDFCQEMIGPAKVGKLSRRTGPSS